MWSVVRQKEKSFKKNENYSQTIAIGAPAHPTIVQYYFIFFVVGLKMIFDSKWVGEY